MKQPWNPDPLYVEPEPVRGIDGIRPSPVIPITMACAVIVIAVLLIVAAASRSPLERSPVPTASGAPREPVSAALHPPEPTTGVGSEGVTLAPTTPIPGATTWSGTATWFCGAGSRCPRGHGPSELIAAIDRKDSPFRKGDRVTVRYHCGNGCERAVTVRIVDVCACGGARLIDLSAKAFRRLAPLGTGVIPVTIEAATNVRLPETDKEK